MGDVDNDEVPTKTPRDLAIDEFPEYASPAQSSIQICVGDSSNCWAPLFTHQQFLGEKIFGYKSPSIVIRYSDPDLRVHVSATATERLAVTTGKDGARKPVQQQQPADDLAECLRSSLPDDFPEEQLAVKIVKGGSSAAGVSAPPSDDRFFPSVKSIASECDAATGRWAPPGPQIGAYSTPDGRHFALHRWRLDFPSASSYHDRLSTLSMWLIETASPVDTSDEAWTVYGLYEKKSADADCSGLKLAGYATVYAFTTPFRKPRPCSVRLAQLLLLPPYQRSGHGLRIMDAIYADADAVVDSNGSSSSSSSGSSDRYPLATTDIASSSSSYSSSAGSWLGGPFAGIDAHEVTVESPCEGMARLRDVHDFTRTLRLGGGELTSLLPWWPQQIAAAGSSDSYWRPDGSSACCPPLPVRDLCPKDVEPLRCRLRCTLGQAYRVVEALTLASLGRKVRSDEDKADAIKPFRLAVKKRILACDDDLRACADVVARKALLEDAYQAAYAQYMSALAAVRAPHPLVTSEEARSVVAAFKERELQREKELERQVEEGQR